MRSRLQNAARDEHGVTLVELIVASGLLAMMLVVVVTFFSAFTRTLNVDIGSTTSMTTAAIGMNEVTRVVRSGTEIPVQGQSLNLPVFIQAGNEHVLMYAFLDTSSTDPAPIKVDFAINAGRELVETRWDSYVINTSYWAFLPTAASERVIARKIVARTGSEPYLFTYYDSAGNVIATDGSGNVPSANLRSIAAVRVALKVQADPTGHADPVQLENTVGIPNLGISRVGASQ
jgi:Flp pilus assembly pilin Flp